MISQKIKVGNQEIELEVGRFAQQASGAVLVTSGETVVLVTVVAGRENPGLGYFPLTVEYQEKLYASGIIKGSRWVKREGKPTDEAVLKARLIDRSIRPLFPAGYMKEIQVVATVLSYDLQNDPDILGLIGTSAALSISQIPWAGPIAAVRIGLNDKDELLVNPKRDEQASSRLELTVSGSSEAIVMVEAGAKEVSEAKMLEALDLAQKQIQVICDGINQLAGKLKIKKEAFTADKVDAAVKKQILAKAKVDLDKLLDNLAAKAATEVGPREAMDEIINAVKAELADLDGKVIADVVQSEFTDRVRQKILTKKSRADNRKPDQIRELSSAVSVLPRTHGSAIFARGATQALTLTTLGSPSLEQLIEDLDGETSKRYIHHYNFPSFSVGETGRFGWPSRREVGHGALAERALAPMIPDKDKFPYTIRVVSEVMSSNGSTSMASVCGSTLSLMDAGVPLIKPVAGIAMGLIAVTDAKAIKDYVVLTDIAGLEDHLGDMDFKVAGTKDGITALQMDIKISGVTAAILKEALDAAKTARLKILEHMLTTLPEPKKQLSAFAPKIATINIPVEKIGELIGPGGRIIKKIIKETGCDVDVDDDGRVVISGTDSAKLKEAVDWISGLTREFVVGEEFDGKVVRVEAYGAFVELLPGRDGLVHVSRLSTSYVADPNTIVKLDDILHVRVREIDEQGRVSLTALTPEQEQQAAQNRPSGGGRPGGFSPRPGGFRPGGSRPPFRRDSRGGGNRDRGPRR
ncbi:MAG: polyribonucleotide nucleotidyltransferase [Patescibacteria group bacterium]|nr:polyribonucleotide nucleotidyltransferase [Patescibacteria group bacterium]